MCSKPLPDIDLVSWVVEQALVKSTNINDLKSDFEV